MDKGMIPPDVVSPNLRKLKTLYILAGLLTYSRVRTPSHPGLSGQWQWRYMSGT
jgi:hypothetical protein